MKHNLKSPANAEDIIKQIEQAGDLELDNIIHAVIRRYNALRTDREGGFLSLSTDPRQHEKELKNIIRFIHKD